MTDEEITRQLAEKVMDGDYRFWNNDTKVWFDQCFNTWKIESEDFEPLTNISHAWMVVERMREKGYTYSIHQHPAFDPVVYFEKNSFKRYSSQDKSICRAIALATLAAVEGE